MLLDTAENVKRYAPPPHRNHALNRRKSGENFGKVDSSCGNDGEKNQAYPVTDHVAGSSSNQSENSVFAVIPLNGCCGSEAAKLLNERWIAAMHSYNDQSIDLSEKPVMFSGPSGTSCGQLKLPHQMDFLAELLRAIHSSAATT